MKRRQVDFPQELFGNIDGVIVTPTLGSPVGSKVLDAGDHTLRVGQVRALESAHPGCAHQRT